MRYAWIQQYREVYPVARTCLLLGVARSGYYAWQRWAQQPSERTRENALARGDCRPGISGTGTAEVPG
ncbi:MAG: hypothetical protein R3B95_07705 [Nitrospirales bacterium]|nr:hypothetical protein [Nitrospirales bacterium]